MIPQTASFGRATRRIVLGIKVKDQTLPLEFMEAPHFSVLVWGFKGRGFFANLGSGHGLCVCVLRFREQRGRVHSFDVNEETMDT